MNDRMIGQEALERLSQAASQAVIGCDQAGRICLVNEHAEHLLGLPAADLLDHNLQEFLPEQPLHDALSLLVEQVMEGAALAEGQITLADESVVPVTIVRVAEAPDSAPGIEGNFLRQLGKPGDIRDMIHNVKGPISAAKSLIDLATLDELSTEKRKGFLDRSQARLAAAITMINQVLDIAWLGNDGQLNCTATNINDILQHSVRDMEGYAQSNGVILSCTFGQATFPTCSDQNRLLGVMGNLISNAIKYSPNGGTVRVRSDLDEGRVRIEVIDQGIGIEAEHLSHLWEPYYRVRNSLTQRIEGSGLGLSVVKLVIEKHGGGVFVSSVPGKGSTFGFWLPLVEES